MFQCRGCNRHFTRLSAFDTHRTGKFEPKAFADRRRCMSDVEMRLVGLVQRNAGDIWGMMQTKRGQAWHTRVNRHQEEKKTA